MFAARGVGDLGLRDRADVLPEPVELEVSLVDRVNQRPIPAVVLWFQGQVSVFGDFPLGTQQSVGQLEQLVGPARQAPVVPFAEGVEALAGGLRRLRRGGTFVHNHDHGSRFLVVLLSFGNTSIGNEGRQRCVTRRRANHFLSG